MTIFSVKEFHTPLWHIRGPLPLNLLNLLHAWTFTVPTFPEKSVPINTIVSEKTTCNRLTDSQACPEQADLSSGASFCADNEAF